MSLIGLGMYPDETCFDTSRPSWLPYVVDDLTEITCAANELFFGNTTGNTAQAGQTGAAPQTVANAQAACASSNGTWNATLNVCQQSFLQQYGMYLLGAAVITVIAIVVVKR